MNSVKDCLWLLGEILTLGGLQRLADAKEKYQAALSEYENLKPEVERLSVQNRELLVEIGKCTISTFKAIKKFEKILRAKIEIENDRVPSNFGHSSETHTEIRKLNDRYSSAAHVGVGASSGGALVVGAWTLVSITGTASTGTAISTLSGAAAYNATLAWFGSGAIAAGGAGMAGGTLILVGIFLLPIFFSWGFSIHKKSKKLEEGTIELESEILNIPTELEKLNATKLALDCHHRTIRNASIELTQGLQYVANELYGYGWFSHIARKLRQAFGHQYFDEQESTLITNSCDDVARYMSLFRGPK